MNGNISEVDDNRRQVRIEAETLMNSFLRFRELITSFVFLTRLTSRIKLSTLGKK
jgi:hypothetical protein